MAAIDIDQKSQHVTGLLRVSKAMLALVICAYPFTLFVFGTKVSYLYFPLVTIALFVSVWVANRRISIKKKNAGLYTILAFLFLITLINIGDLRYSFPVIFFLTTGLFIIVIDNASVSVSNRALRYVVFFYIAFSGFLYLIKFNFVEGRFAGFSESATTFAVFLTALLTIAMSLRLSRKLFWLWYIAILFLILTSKTRLNLAFLLALPFLFSFEASKRQRIGILLLFILSINFVYPIYNHLRKNIPVLSYRYGSDFDPSYVTRVHFQKKIIASFSEGTVVEKLFGQGTEQARIKIISTEGGDYLPHNDFLRILNDYGIFGILFFLAFLISIGSRNRITLCLCTLYMLSFYHNMVYNFFILFSILLFINVHDSEFKKSVRQ